MPRIVLLAADDVLRRSLQDQLARHGFSVIDADGADAPDLVLLDGDGAGGGAGRWTAPCIVLGGSGPVAGTRLDKPFRFADLLRAIETQIKAAQPAAQGIALGSFVFHPSARRLEGRGGRSLRLTEKETAILDYLTQAGGRVVSRTELLGSVWGYADDADTHTVETHIYRLRRKMGSSALLVTENGGYRLQA